ncbi:MAG: hypothetical protein L0220_28500 [Acidobacteria bacterium]|nr:hypothetical protein [Acidobacteriota bacterium]
MGKFIPDEPIQADPSNRVCINRDWAPYILGLLAEGNSEAYWRELWENLNPSDAQIDLAIKSMAEIEADLSAEPGACLPPAAECPDGVNFSSSTDFLLNLAPWIVSVGTWTIGVGVEPADILNADGFFWQQISMIAFLGAQTLCLREFIINYDWEAELFISGCANPLALASVCNLVRLSTSGNEAIFATWHATSALNHFMGLSGASATGLAVPGAMGSLKIDAFFGRDISSGGPRRGRIRSVSINGVIT